MLDRLQLAAALQNVSTKLFPDLTDVSTLAYKTYQQIAHDETFVERAAEAQSSFLVPTWQGNLLDTPPTGQTPESYTVVAVDGSQVYPDRHISGAGCFLLNTGGVALRYGATSSAHFFSTPRVCISDELRKADENLPFGAELVDLMREDDELKEAVVKAKEFSTDVVLLDGTIIFWPLEGKSPEVRRIFMQRYLASMQALYEARIPYAGYISMPKSRELINLIKLGLCRFTTANCIPCHATYNTFPCKAVDMLIDTHVVGKFVQPGQRTTLFASASNIVAEYPAHLRPLFCYVHVGREIARLEIPAWVANDSVLLDRICQVARDQSEKGSGYPVCLAEAHEQAVIKGPDRDFFYHLINKLGLVGNRQLVSSQKSIKKRGMGI